MPPLARSRGRPLCNKERIDVEKRLIISMGIIEYIHLFFSFNEDTKLSKFELLKDFSNLLLKFPLSKLFENKYINTTMQNISNKYISLIAPNHEK